MPEKLSTFEGAKKLYKDLRSRIKTLSDSFASTITNVNNKIIEEANKRSEADDSIRTSMQDVKQELSNDIVAEREARAKADKTETENRAADVNKLRQSIDSNKSTQDQVNKELVQSVAEEIEARKTADETLSNALRKQTSNIDTKLADEILARQQGDKTLTDSLSEEVTRASTAELLTNERITEKSNELQAAITAEAQSRSDGDARLEQLLNKEVTDRKEAILNQNNDLVQRITTVQNNLNTESSTREEEDSKLQQSLQQTNENVLVVEDTLSKVSAKTDKNSTNLSNEIITRQNETKDLQDAVAKEIVDRSARDNQLKADITQIDNLIPNAATKDNQLADKAFVNSSINSIASFFRGSYKTKDSLVNKPWQTTDEDAEYYVHNNDYAYVQSDETHDGEAWRYVYVLIPPATEGTWEAQFKINDSPLTQAQLDALNSTITKNAVEQITTNKDGLTLINQDFNVHATDYNNPHKVTATQLGLGNVDNTSDLDKPISNATKEVIENVSSTSLAHITNKNNPHDVTKDQVGLGNVDNTADKDKPVSDAQSKFITDLYKPMFEHIFDFDNPHGVTKDQLGLGKVDNTSDAEKPLSRAADSALALKAPINSPQFEGIPQVPTPATDASDSQIANVGYVKKTVSSQGLVSFRENQLLTDDQKKTARDNIGAVESEQEQETSGKGIVKLTGSGNFDLYNTYYGNVVKQGTSRPDALSSITFCDGNFEVVGKNLVKVPVGQTIDGVRFEVSAAGIIQTYGTAQESINYVITSQYYPHGVYSISGCPNGGGVDTYSVQFNLYQGNNYITGVANYSTDSSTSTLNTALYPSYDVCKVIIHIEKGQDVTGKLFYPQLEFNDKITAFEAIKSDNSIFNGQLRAMTIEGDLPDDILNKEVLLQGVYPIDEANKKYLICDTWNNDLTRQGIANSKLISRIWNKTLSGNEDIVYYNAVSGQERFQIKFTDSIYLPVTSNNQVLVLCNAFEPATANGVISHSEQNTIAVESNADYDCISIYAPQYTTLAQFKTYLKSMSDAKTPVVVYYIGKNIRSTTKDTVKLVAGTDITTVYSNSLVEPYLFASYYANIWELLKNQSSLVSDDFVSYNPQTRTEAQKVQARQNIGAVDSDYVDQFASKIDSISVNGTEQTIQNKSVNIIIDKDTVGLGNVDNTSDLDKPISNLTQDALQGLEALIDTKQNAPTYVDYTLLAASWSNSEYSFESTYPNAEYELTIQLAATATAEQAQAFAEAIMVGSSTSNVLKCISNTPTINIPVTIIVIHKP